MTPDSKPLLLAIATLGVMAVTVIAQEIAHEVNKFLKG